ncbi:hypothetical protein JIN84_12825 [Luteolibacter yonseiensis]|uniref:Uncharacterized protein n=1 Tax=Luteolibacter yonseiensis TaxID=1144680 RepID=A0A934V7T6_9BACT|nr:hypothetical protein [Luteolibacter yonseiensis]MBK1816502.1 hypothetical protein [Luteolibacter yonseiensis]
MSRLPAILRVRKTDYRPPGAGNTPPLDRKAGPGAAACPESPTERAAHDSVVATYSLPILRAIAADLGKRAWLNDWSTIRLAAVRRRIREISPT